MEEGGPPPQPPQPEDEPLAKVPRRHSGHGGGAGSVASRDHRSYDWALAEFARLDHEKEWCIVEGGAEEDADFNGPSSSSDAGSFLADVMLVEEAWETAETDNVAVETGSLATCLAYWVAWVRRVESVVPSSLLVVVM